MIQRWTEADLLRPSQQAALSQPLIAAFAVGCMKQHAEGLTLQRAVNAH